MLLYQVDQEVDASVAEEFAAWLPGHVAKVVAQGGFAGADVFRDETASAPARFSVHFRVPDRGTLDRYLQASAPALRADLERRYPGKISASRRVLTHVFAAPGAPSNN
jgi:quinol monooxygenase YgiN